VIILSHFSYYGFICLLIRISSGCMCLSARSDGLIVCSGSINGLSMLLAMRHVKFYGCLPSLAVLACNNESCLKGTLLLGVLGGSNRVCIDACEILHFS
jgi:hypothetical protein